MLRVTTRIFIAFLASICLGVPGAEASSAEQADLDYARGLLAGNGISVPAGQIERVLRDQIETLIWTTARRHGKPVFFYQAGYSFDSDGQLRRGADGEPMLLGRIPDASSFPIDERADVPSAEAVKAYRAKLGAQGWSPHAYMDVELETMLGFHDVNIGSGREPQFLLAWRVRPVDRSYPVAIVSAKKGNVLFFDTGVRYALPPGPAGDGASEPSR